MRGRDEHRVATGARPARRRRASGARRRARPARRPASATSARAMRGEDRAVHRQSGILDRHRVALRAPPRSARRPGPPRSRSRSTRGRPPRRGRAAGVPRARGAARARRAGRGSRARGRAPRAASRAARAATAARGNLDEVGEARGRSRSAARARLRSEAGRSRLSGRFRHERARPTACGAGSPRPAAGRRRPRPAGGRRRGRSRAHGSAAGGRAAAGDPCGPPRSVRPRAGRAAAGRCCGPARAAARAPELVPISMPELVLYGAPSSTISCGRWQYRRDHAPAPPSTPGRTDPPAAATAARARDRSPSTTSRSPLFMAIAPHAFFNGDRARSARSTAHYIRDVATFYAALGVGSRRAAPALLARARARRARRCSSPCTASTTSSTSPTPTPPGPASSTSSRCSSARCCSPGCGARRRARTGRPSGPSRTRRPKGAT